MAVEAIGSRYKKKMGFVMALMFLGIAAYCLYDGWSNQAYIDKHMVDGKPDINLQINRVWFPVLAVLVAIYEVVSSTRLATKRVIADERGLSISGQDTIPYTQITFIDKRFFAAEGHFTVGYNTAQGPQKVKLSDRNYDNLLALFEELVAKTGAAPADKAPDSPA